jgi:hypothetical protein
MKTTIGRLAILTILAGLLGLALPAAANISVQAACQDGAITIDIHLQDVSGDDPVGILVTRYTVGICDSHTVLNPDDLLPWPEDGQALDHQLIDDQIDEGWGYFYRLVAVDSFGEEHPVVWPPEARAIAGCGVWGLTRGVLPEPDEYGYFWEFPACECWYGAMTLDASGLEPTVWEPYVGQMVEIRGEPFFSSMPGGPDVIVTGIVAAESCDGPVATVRTTWHTLKSRFR